MKILLISQYYKPVKSAATKRVARFAEYFSSNGHQVTILTGTASYPTGIIPKEYRGKLWCKEKEGEINIIRTYEYPTSNEGFLKRILNYVSFMVSSSITVLFIRRHDVVIVSSPSFFSGVAGLTAKFFKRSRFIFDVRDLWPDSAIDLGMAKPESLPAKILYWLEKVYYKKATKIMVATPSIKEHLLGEKWPENKIEVLINSVDTDKFQTSKINRHDYGFTDKDFILTYTGTHSGVQDLKTLIKAATLLKDNEDIKFILVGEGETKHKLQEETEKLKLKNVTFWPQKDQQEIIKIINFSDVGIISLANIPIFQEAFPVKSSEYFACAKPVIAAIGGEMAKLISQYEAGIVVRSGHPEDKAKAINKLYKDRQALQKMGQNARKLAEDFFSDQIFYQKLDKITKELN